MYTIMMCLSFLSIHSVCLKKGRKNTQLQKCKFIKKYFSAMRGLYLLEWPREMLQNLIYFRNKKIHFIEWHLVSSSNECPTVYIVMVEN